MIALRIPVLQDAVMRHPIVVAVPTTDSATSPNLAPFVGAAFWRVVLPQSRLLP